MPSGLARATGRTLYEPLQMMFRWVFFAILAVLVVSWLFSKQFPWLEKRGFSKFNSSLSFRLLGKMRYIPVTYVVLLATAAYLLVALLYKQ